MGSVDVRRSAERYRTTTEWLESRHSFAFGAHFDPANSGFGLLVAHNDDIVAPGTGFGDHRHSDIEIVTWVLQGSLVHTDSDGHSGLIRPGLVQALSAGSGIRHTERNDSWRLTGEPPHDEPVRFVQMWVLPDETALAPGYAQRDVDAELATGELIPVASGLRGRDAAIRINQSRAALSAGRLPPAKTVGTPVAPYVHLFVAAGTVELEGTDTQLATGDAVRITGSDGPRLTAGGDGAEVLVWQMYASR